MARTTCACGFSIVTSTTVAASSLGDRVRSTAHHATPSCTARCARRRTASLPSAWLERRTHPMVVQRRAGVPWPVPRRAARRDRAGAGLDHAHGRDLAVIVADAGAASARVRSVRPHVGAIVSRRSDITRCSVVGETPTRRAGARPVACTSGTSSTIGPTAPVLLDETDPRLLAVHARERPGTPKGVMHRHGDLEATARTYARARARDQRRGSLLLGREAVLRVRARELADVPALGRRDDDPRSVASDARRGRRARWSASGPTLFFASPGFCAALLDADVDPAALASVRLGVTAGEALPAAVCIAGSPRVTASPCSTASARPRRSTSSCRTVRAPSDRARAARSCRATRSSCSTSDDAVDRRPTRPGYLQVGARRSRPVTGSVPTRPHSAFRGEWLRTGDVYTRSDDGYWTFLGRNNDMIKAGGIWVSPAEVEEVLVEHDDVLEAAVVGGARRRRPRDGGGLRRAALGHADRPRRDRRALPRAHGRRSSVRVGDRRRRAAEDRDRQGPALRPARPARASVVVRGGQYSRRRRRHVAG